MILAAIQLAHASVVVIVAVKGSIGVVVIYIGMLDLSGFEALQDTTLNFLLFYYTFITTTALSPALKIPPGDSFPNLVFMWYSLFSSLFLFLNLFMSFLRPIIGPQIT